MTTIATVTLGDKGFAVLNDKIDRLNRKAVKHGLAPMTVTVERELQFVKIIRTKRGVRFGGQRTLHVVRVEGVEPVISGWRLLARIEFDDILGMVVRTAPGVENIPDKCKTATCEHCNTQRRRNDVFVLEGPDGQTKVVGRNCLADFVRDGDAETLARFAEFSEIVRAHEDGDYDEYDCCGRLPDPIVHLNQYLPVVALMTRRFGWVSRTEVKESLVPKTATADDANYFLYGKEDSDKQNWIDKHDLSVEAKDNDLAGRAIEWAQTAGGNEYLNTISAIAKAGRCNYKHTGYAASIITAYQKACDREAEFKEKTAKLGTREFFGSVGQRYRGVDVTVKRVRYTEGYYGTKTIVTLETKNPAEGVREVLTWFASGEKDFEEGSDYTVDFTVKDHDDHETYGKSTVITRAKVA